MAWATANTITDPTAGTILADTGALSIGLLSFTILLASSGPSATLELQLRNAANSANVATQTINSTGYGSDAIPVPIVIGLNQRLRLVVVNNYTGDVDASILWG